MLVSDFSGVMSKHVMVARGSNVPSPRETIDALKNPVSAFDTKFIVGEANTTTTTEKKNEVMAIETPLVVPYVVFRRDSGLLKFVLDSRIKMKNSKARESFGNLVNLDAWRQSIKEKDDAYLMAKKIFSSVTDLDPVISCSYSSDLLRDIVMDTATKTGEFSNETELRKDPQFRTMFPRFLILFDFLFPSRD